MVRPPCCEHSLQSVAVTFSAKLPPSIAASENHVVQAGHECPMRIQVTPDLVKLEHATFGLGMGVSTLRPLINQAPGLATDFMLRLKAFGGRC
jgi:hypothetical protein